VWYTYNTLKTIKWEPENDFLQHLLISYNLLDGHIRNVHAISCSCDVEYVYIDTSYVHANKMLYNHKPQKCTNCMHKRKLFWIFYTILELHIRWESRDCRGAKFLSQEALKHTCTLPSVMWSGVKIVALAVLCLGVSTPTQARTCSRQLSDGLLRIGGLYALFMRSLNMFEKTMKSMPHYIVALKPYILMDEYLTGTLSKICSPYRCRSTTVWNLFLLNKNAFLLNSLLCMWGWTLLCPLLCSMLFGSTKTAAGG